VDENCPVRSSQGCDNQRAVLEGMSKTELEMNHAELVGQLIPKLGEFTFSGITFKPYIYHFADYSKYLFDILNIQERLGIKATGLQLFHLIYLPLVDGKFDINILAKSMIYLFNRRLIPDDILLTNCLYYLMSVYKNFVPNAFFTQKIGEKSMNEIYLSHTDQIRLEAIRKTREEMEGQIREERVKYAEERVKYASIAIGSGWAEPQEVKSGFGLTDDELAAAVKMANQKAD
jgi:hypothetical protein